MNRDFVSEWLKGKTAQDFDTIEHMGGRLLWPTKLQRMRSDKTWAVEDVYLQPLDGLDTIAAAGKAAAIFAEYKFSRDDTRFEALWAEIEMYCNVAVALREAKPNTAGVHAQKHTVEQLLSKKESGVSRAQVATLWSELRVFASFEDGRLEEMDTETVVRVAMAIDEVRNVSPLVVIAECDLDTYVISSAALLSSYLRGERSAPSRASSTPGASASTNSATS